MKATGIVRRIDDLGRVVIPKEIRRTMRIREGDPLEIYTSRDGEVIFKKYSLMGGLDDFAAQLCESCWARALPPNWSRLWRTAASTNMTVKGPRSRYPTAVTA